MFPADFHIYGGSEVVGIVQIYSFPKSSWGYPKSPWVSILCHIMSYYVIVIHGDWMIWGYAHDLGTPHTYSAEAPISAHGPHCKLKAGKPAPVV